MKRLVFVVALLLVTAMTVRADGIVSIVPSSVTPRLGQRVTVSFVVNENVGSFTGTLAWNPRVLRFEGVSAAPGFMEAHSVKDGQFLRVSMANIQGGQGAIVTVKFIVVGFGWSVLNGEVETMAQAGTFADLLPVAVRDSMVRVNWFWR